MKKKYKPIEEVEPVRDSFIMYVRWYRCISAFRKNSQGQAYKAVCEYALFDIEVPKDGFTELEYHTLTSFLPIMDSNRQRWENGKKGAVHGSKGGRPKKHKTPKGLSSETSEGLCDANPEGLSDETSDGLSVKTPNGNVKLNYNKNTTVDGDIRDLAPAPTPEYIYNLLLPVFFFRNCDAQREVGRFYKHYSLAEWRLTGGDLLDTPQRLKTAAQRWKVEDSKPFYPPAFISIWQDVYDMAPAELRQDILEISSTTKMPTSITIVCSSCLCKWLTSSEVSPQFVRLQQTKTSRPFRIEVFVRKEK